MTRFGISMGANESTFSGLAGMGDLIATCSSSKSRNTQLGIRLGQGESIEDIQSSMVNVAEGVSTTQAVMKIAKSMKVNMPLTEAVYQVLFENIKPIDAPIDAPFQLAATLGTTTAEELELEKDINGFIKPKATTNENGEIEVAEITANQEVQMVNNYLEKSNVNPVEELILTLEHQRNYETHVKFIDLAKQMDEGGASLMRVPD